MRSVGTFITIQQSDRTIMKEKLTNVLYSLYSWVKLFGPPEDKIKKPEDKVQKKESRKKIPFDFLTPGKTYGWNENYVYTVMGDKRITTYEEIGLFPRSFNRVFDRFMKQLFSDVEELVIQEYRFFRFMFLTTIRCLATLFFVPLVVNVLAKNYIVRPVTEYYWNTQQTEIFLNHSLQKKAFSELHDFEEDLFFESLLHDFEEKISSESLVGKDTKLIEVSKDYKEQTPFPSNSPSNSVDKMESYAYDYRNSEYRKKWVKKKAVVLRFEKFTKEGIPYASNAGHKQDPEMQAKAERLKPIFVDPSGITISNSRNWQKGPQKDTWMLYHPGGPLKFLTMDYRSAVLMKQQRLQEKRKDSRSAVLLKQQRLQEKRKNDRSAVLLKQQRLQEKTIELAIQYNYKSIEAITNFISDLISLLTLLFLVSVLDAPLSITRSFLLEVFFSLDDTKKSLLILFITDLLVGYHSSNLWEFFFQFVFNHYGIPENHTTIFLLVATLPVLLSVLFKYLIFRHLNRASPGTVATYHAMIE